jgi:hypothetical protein
MGKTFSTGLLTNALFTDASNNVGIGAAPSGSYKLEVTGTGRFTSIIYGSNGNLDPTAGTNAGTTLALNGNSVANNYSIGLGAIRNSAYDMWFQTGATNGGGYRWYIGTSEKMTMSSTGDVGIGTSSPTAALDIDKAEGTMMRVKRTGVAGEFQMYQGPNVVYLDSAAASGNLAFATVGTERMRIQSNGIIKMTSTSGSYGQLQLTSSDTESGIGFRLTGNVDEASWVIGKGVGGAGASFALYYAGVKGSLTTAGVWSTTGGGTSDLRTKQDIDYDFDNGIESIIKLQPTKFKFKNAPDKQRRGFIAQDVLSVIPDLVLGDGELEDGTYGLDYDGILALAVKAIQELNERLNKAGL